MPLKSKMPVICKYLNIFPVLPVYIKNTQLSIAVGFTSSSRRLAISIVLPIRARQSIIFCMRFYYFTFII